MPICMKYDLQHLCVARPAKRGATCSDLHSRTHHLFAVTFRRRLIYLAQRQLQALGPSALQVRGHRLGLATMGLEVLGKDIQCLVM